MPMAFRRTLFQLRAEAHSLIPDNPIALRLDVT